MSGGGGEGGDEGCVGYVCVREDQARCEWEREGEGGDEGVCVREDQVRCEWEREGEGGDEGVCGLCVCEGG